VATGERKVRVGDVVSNAMEKTAIVKVSTMQQHPKFKKYQRKMSKVAVHDEENQLQVGDRVRIVETRPLSRTKRWRLLEVIEKTK
jgi:small subunit ribosomal protein S17